MGRGLRRTAEPGREAHMSRGGPLPRTLLPASFLGGLTEAGGECLIEGGAWYEAAEPGDGLDYRFESGALAGLAFLTADLLATGIDLPVLRLTLREGESGPAFHMDFGLLNQCAARMAVPLAAVSQNRWRYSRRGAWLKPCCGGDAVDLRKVDRMTLVVLRMGDRPLRWCMGPIAPTLVEPPPLEGPALPAGPLIDPFGQSTLRDWPGKTRSEEELVGRLRAQAEQAPRSRRSEGLSRWGGWMARRVEATGFFRTHHDGRRWWLVDPDGYAFWSAGMDCVRVDTDAAYARLQDALAWMPDAEGPYAVAYGQGECPTVNYLAANLVRAFGPEEWYARWSEVALGELRGLGINTVGNWSDWRLAREAGFPYVRPLELDLDDTPAVFRDFPDVFHPAFPDDAALFAGQLRETLGDPALVGYFLMNEPTWGFAQETPAAGMLLNTPVCAARHALATFLRERHGGDAALSAAWDLDIRLDEVAEGEWTLPLTRAAREDLEAFSAVMTTQLFTGLSAACCEVDPAHLNLGARYYTTPPRWALAGMRCFDLFSMNCYRSQVPAERVASIASALGLPVLVGEWHFGALDVGLPGSGICRVRDQLARGQAYRFYLENAAALAECVGTHYFTLYDESALGRFDGENWNIGFVDVCGRAYEPLMRAAREAHDRMYRVAAGEEPPFADAPEYLPPAFL